jgi:hypothetical protein
MSALALGLRPLAAAAPDAVARLFAEKLLSEQKVPRLARRGASRALALLLARSAGSRGPVTLSALEGARLCGFEPRTWWLVKRRLLELGHLVATTGGAPPSGRPGGRGKKASYCVAPETLARFEEALCAGGVASASQETGKALAETLNARAKTLNARGDSSQHRGSHRSSLRLLEKRTSDVPSLEGDDERPSIAAVWAWAQREERPRVQVALLRLLETLLLVEALAPRAERNSDAPEPETVMGPPRPGGTKARRPRASAPLWSGASGEEASVLAHVRSILEWANREHGARFEVKKSSQDTLLYPFECVRSAVANVLLKRARGYRFENPGAVLWDGITLEGYKLDEFSVASLEEIEARLERAPSPKKKPGALGAEMALKAKERTPLVFEPEKEKRALLQALYQKLPESERRALDERAEALAREDLGEAASPARVALRKLDKRNELLQARAAAQADAGVTQRAPRESQIPESASARDETEPNPHVPVRT